MLLEFGRKGMKNSDSTCLSEFANSLHFSLKGSDDLIPVLSTAFLAKGFFVEATTDG